MYPHKRPVSQALIFPRVRCKECAGRSDSCDISIACSILADPAGEPGWRYVNTSDSRRELALTGLPGQSARNSIRRVKPKFRIFVSSPGDVKRAREFAVLTVETLAQDYARYLLIEPYLWEFEAMVASGHFEDSIEPPSAFDIVVFIVWSRLGTVMPERTSVREYRGIDGRMPVTGTEWEFEEALRRPRRAAPPICSCIEIAVRRRSISRSGSVRAAVTAARSLEQLLAAALREPGHVHRRL